jgi:hypothetical protein
MPKERGRDAYERPVQNICLASLDDVYGLLIDHHLMEPRFDQPAGDVLQLLAGLHEQIVAGRDLDRDALASVARPDVQAWIARTAVDGEKVEVRVEAGENGVFGAVLREVGGCRGEEVRSSGW